MVRQQILPALVPVLPVLYLFHLLSLLLPGACRSSHHSDFPDFVCAFHSCSGLLQASYPYCCSSKASNGPIRPERQIKTMPCPLSLTIHQPRLLQNHQIPGQIRLRHAGSDTGHRHTTRFLVKKLQQRDPHRIRQCRENIALLFSRTQIKRSFF